MDPSSTDPTVAAPALGPAPVAAGDLQLSLDEARAAIAAALKPVGGVEHLPLQAALGRVLAADVISSIDVPAHDNSAMDGYAFDGAALVATAALSLQAVGTALAGPPFAGDVGLGQCVRIMTGAVIPAGLNTVVPIELCEVEGEGGGEADSDAGSESNSEAGSEGATGQVRIAAQNWHPGDNIRLRGEDLAKGHSALTAGRVLRAADLGLMASLGIETVAVRPRLRVAVFSTGNELRDLGQTLDPGCIYDSNRHALMAAVRRLGMEAIDLGVVRDEPAALQATLEDALSKADAVLTSGGVSAGDADYTRTLLAGMGAETGSGMGAVAFWKVALRPGRPFAFGPVAPSSPSPSPSPSIPSSQNTPATRPGWLFALPGNPVAALVTFYALVRDGLLQLAGATPLPLPTLRVRCTQTIRKRPGRTELQRGLLSPGANGQWQVALAGAQGAGMLRSMCQANALIVLGHEQASVAAGDWVDVWLFDGLT